MILFVLFLPFSGNSETKDIARELAREHDVPPELVIAIVDIESGWDKRAIGSSHGEVGLMQLRPEFHKCASFDPKQNLRCGIKYLKYIKDRHVAQWGCHWPVFYNHGPNAKLSRPWATAYAKKLKQRLGDLCLVPGMI